MKVNQYAKQEIMDNESLIAEISKDITLTCEEVKELLVEIALDRFFHKSIRINSISLISSYIKENYLEVENE